MKKYVSAIISVVMLIASTVFSVITPQTGIKAGAGRGTSSQVATLEEIYSVMDYLSRDLFAGMDGNDEEKVETAHTSGTMTETMTLKNEVYKEESKKVYPYPEDNPNYYRYTDQTTITTTTLNRTLTIYMTENANYYVSKGTMKTEEEIEYHSSDMVQSFMDFDMEIYIARDICLMKFNRFVGMECEKDMEGNYVRTTASVQPTLKGLWIELPLEVGGLMFQTINSANESGLAELQEEINKAIAGEKGFEKEGASYIWTKEGRKDVPYMPKTEFKLSFANTINPCVDMKVDSIRTAVEIPENGSYNILKTDANMSFYNIDNTVIDVNVTPKYVIKTFEEFIDILNLKEEEIGEE